MKHLDVLDNCFPETHSKPDLISKRPVMHSHKYLSVQVHTLEVLFTLV